MCTFDFVLDHTLLPTNIQCFQYLESSTWMECSQGPLCLAAQHVFQTFNNTLYMHSPGATLTNGPCTTFGV